MKSVTRQYDLRLLILLVPASAILAGINVESYQCRRKIAT
jgi:hypothetical protein